MAGDWRALHVEKLHYLFCSRNNITAMKSRRVRGHVRGRRNMPAEFQWGNLSETDYLIDLGVDGKITIKLVFKKQGGRA